MNVASALKLARGHEVLKGVTNKMVCTQIVPEPFRYTEDNKLGMFPHPTAITVGPTGYLFMINREPEDGSSMLCELQLHNPVRVKVINSYDFIIHDLAYHNGVVFLATERGLYYHDLKQSVPVQPSKLRTHAAIDSVYLDLNVENNGVTIRDKQEFLTEHIKTVKIQRGSIPKGAVHNSFQELTGPMTSILVVDWYIMYVCMKRTVFKCCVRRDGVGLTIGEISDVCTSYKAVSSMAIVGENLLLATAEFVVMYDLKNQTQRLTHVEAICVAKFQSSVIFTDRVRNNVRMSVDLCEENLAIDLTKPGGIGSTTGLAENSLFGRARCLAVEFD